MSGKGGKGSHGSHRTCEICGAKERHLTSGSTLFSRFPLDEIRCKAWLRAAGNEELVHLPIEKLHQLRYICGNHFQRKDFNKKGNRLKKRAIPLINLSANPLSDDQLIGFPQRMWRSRNVSVPEEPCEGPSSKQAEITRNVSVPEEPCAGPSTNQAEMTRNELTPTSKPKKDLEKGKERKLKAASSKSKNEITMPMCQSQQNEEKMQRKRKLQETTDLTPRKKKLIERLSKTKCTLRSLRESGRVIEKIESPVLKEIVLNACKNQRRKPKGRRWTTQNKISALAIFKRSPKTYRYLQKIIPLPSEKTLQNILKKIPMQPGINIAVLNHLNNISKDRDIKDNQCCLLFDEMAIKPRLILNMATDLVEGYVDGGSELGRSKELADHALVFMVQGLRQKFKQPVAFYFVKGTISSQKLANIIKNIINEISSTGFKVLSTVCDQGPTNMGALKLLRESSGLLEDGSNNYFKVNEGKVFIIYDIPHLFKSIRNNFLKNGTIIMNKKKAQWSHLVEVEKKNRNFLYLSKISQTHVAPKYRAKMKVKYAAQILSTTVAAVLKLISISEKDLHANQLMESALVIQELDRLFDLTNGPSSHKDIKKGLRENVSEKTQHLNKWSEWIKKLCTFKFVNNNGNEARNIKCIEGYIISLKSLRDLWQTLHGLGFKYFNLRQVNQDALENLFGVIRQTSPTNRNPTCSHFMAALKTAVVTKLSYNHSRGSNCEEDQKNLLTDFHNLIFCHTNPSQLDMDKEEDEDETIDVEYPILSIPAEDLDEEDDLINICTQPEVYISGYLVSRIFKNHKCEKCGGNLKIDNPPDIDACYDYIRLREWWQDKQSLTYPTAALCRLVNTAVAVTEKEVCPRLHEQNIIQLTITMLYAHCDIEWFTCIEHKKQIFKMLFTRLALLFLRRHCQIINETIASQEERFADANKIAQQQGTAK